MAMDSAKRGEIMELAKQQIAVANAQELLSKMTQRCFKKCVNKPGYSLDSSEQKCISMCMDRFMDSWDLISRAYGQRIQREQQNQ
ncbi:mitochondrial import inner membrane translocase subunit Tim13 [Drosophila subobscura]|uniref:mitochondrial import inner membrane translocase subunit Tim13 n=1 Tax=Drosophila subobscura TaxID=7241 RepID=UPI00155A2FB5|nr:mitochondrial import inner membrane translocase subunit Tim13 [Drosophila subobscura]